LISSVGTGYFSETNGRQNQRGTQVQNVTVQCVHSSHKQTFTRLCDGVAERPREHMFALSLI